MTIDAPSTRPADDATAATPRRTVRLGVVGLGKMGLSHLSMINAHPDVQVEAVVDAAGYMLDVLGKYTGMATFPSIDAMLAATDLDAVLVATPTRLHAPMVRSLLEAGVDVFCEKPLSLTAADSEELAALAAERGRVTQVGYHNRFVGAFREVKRLLDLGAIGRVTHIQAEAYGPVVLRGKGGTWRSDRNEGGGALYDYAAHPLDLMTWYAGEVQGAGGTVLESVFSSSTEDQVYGTLFFGEGVSGQLSVDWSDESYRKMTTQLTISGTAGRIHADRQECQLYLRDTAPAIDGYTPGWNVRYTTELTDPVWFYLRGEEYSAQLDYFVQSVLQRRTDGLNSFASAAATDRALTLLTADASGTHTTTADGTHPATATAAAKSRRFPWRRR
ncbi:Gfo/Idh/MocA family oxidoreductase [Leifsonia sp. fls2-241-R2A-40a]|uniref:Gfo/Idh/MocA family protein n=1 Tax=Leifsonia sp. fls2-241-R2A-40a TaxID=3040290 RepID=UPI00254DCF77|nr:Gfo/Idh/MocA family oxidoreductase [Leifsonia sp. fls2-241-R2A-40a]